LVTPDSMAIADLAGVVDFTLAFAMVHELLNAAWFFGSSSGIEAGRAAAIRRTAGACERSTV